MENAFYVSILIPVYNADQYISQCLESVLHQTVQSFEIVIVDDGSQDDTIAVCTDYCKVDSRIRLIQQEHGGVSKARNQCLKSASYEWVTFIDSDDWVEPDYLFYLISLQKKTDSQIVECNHWVETGRKKILAFKNKKGYHTYSYNEAFDHILYHEKLDIAPWGKLYHISVFEGVSYPEGMRFEDTWIIADLLYKAGNITMGDEPKYHYRYMTESLSKGGFNTSRLDFIKAVDHLTEVIQARNPYLKKGCIRRKTHAALSVRRNLVQCDKQYYPIRKSIDEIILQNQKIVLLDKRSPVRDKIGLLCIKCSDLLYDYVWSIYEIIKYDRRSI